MTAIQLVRGLAHNCPNLLVWILPLSNLPYL